MEIVDKLRAQARQNPRRIVLFEGEEDRTLAAAAEIEREGIARLTLLGDPDKIRARTRELGLKIESSQIMNPATSAKVLSYARLLYSAAARKA